MPPQLVRTSITGFFFSMFLFGCGVPESSTLHTLQDKNPRTLHGHDGAQSVAFSPNGKMLASGGTDGKVKIWHIESGKITAIFPRADRDEVRFVTYNPDGKIVAFFGSDSNIKLWDPTDAEETRLIPVSLKRDCHLSAVCFSPDGKTIAEASDSDNSPHLRDLATGKILVDFPAPKGLEYPRCLAFSPSGRLLAAGYSSSTIRVWDVGGKEIAKIEVPRPVHSVAFSPDGETLAAAASENSIRLWDLATGKEKAMLAGPKDNPKEFLHTVAFSPDGTLIAACGFLGKCERPLLWEVNSGKLVAILEGHEAYCVFVAFSPDGKLLASCSRDNTIKLWNIPSILKNK